MAVVSARYRIVCTSFVLIRVTIWAATGQLAPGNWQLAIEEKEKKGTISL